MTVNPTEQPFIWGVGIEDTNIGWPIAKDGRGLDEYELTEHYQRWKSDFDLVLESGASVVRYGLPWYRINPAPGQYDWSWADQVIAYAAGDLGLDLILDLVHYGTPRWLAGSFTDPAYPSAIADYAGAVATRYAGRIHQFTPLNEPLVTASFTGTRGIWPPYEHGDAGWARVVVNVAEGIQRSIRAIRAAQPDAEIVHVEATHVWTTDDPGLAGHRARLDDRNYLPTDLILGRVSPGHRLYRWLVDLGIPAERLHIIAQSPAAPDVIGLNYYPDLSCRELVSLGDSVVGVARNGWTAGLRKVIMQFHQRYGLPILISETGIEGNPEVLVDWLRSATQEAASLRAAGLPVLGLTWWPLFDFVDWSWGSDGEIVEEFYTRNGDSISPIIPPPTSNGLESFFRHMGLWNLRLGPGGIERVHTSAATAFAQASRAALTGEKVTEP